MAYRPNCMLSYDVLAPRRWPGSSQGLFNQQDGFSYRKPSFWSMPRLTRFRSFKRDPVINKPPLPATHEANHETAFHNLEYPKDKGKSQLMSWASEFLAGGIKYLASKWLFFFLFYLTWLYLALVRYKQYNLRRLKKFFFHLVRHRRLNHRTCLWILCDGSEASRESHLKRVFPIFIS